MQCEVGAKARRQRPRESRTKLLPGEVDIDVDASVAAESSCLFVPCAALRSSGSSCSSVTAMPCHANALWKNDCRHCPSRSLSTRFQQACVAQVPNPPPGGVSALLHPTPLLLAQQPHRPAAAPHHATPRHDAGRGAIQRWTDSGSTPTTTSSPAPATSHQPPAAATPPGH